MTTQLGLLQWTPPQAAPRADEQTRQIIRVARGIAMHVLDYVQSVGVGGTFTAEQLRAYVSLHTGRAPGSADRILRDLRAKGHADVRCINRAGSLYRVEGIFAPRGTP